MFREIKETQSSGEMTALLEVGCSFEGKLTFEGTVRINGRFTGEIFSEGTLIVGEEGEVEARIEVRNAIINGKVRGEIEAKDRIEMRSPAEVRGNINATTLVIDEGVLFEGSCKMGTSQQSSASLGDVRETTHHEPMVISRGDAAESDEQISAFDVN